MNYLYKIDSSKFILNIYPSDDNQYIGHQLLRNIDINIKPNIKIGAEYTTYHEPSSPEGKSILKDKKKTAKALKNVNSPKVMAESKAAGESYDVAKGQETRRMKNN